MNKKRTNYLVTILSLIGIVAYIILLFAGEILDDTITTIVTHNTYEEVSIFGNELVRQIVNNIEIIFISIPIILLVFNIICAIQNRKNKKLRFWYLAEGIVLAYFVIAFMLLSNVEDIEDLFWLTPIPLAIIPTVLAIINLVRIKRNNGTATEIITNILTILLSVGIIIYSIIEREEFDAIGTLDALLIALWLVTSIIMQFIYIHKQEEQEESKKRRIANIIIYYILQLLSIGAFTILITYALITSAIDKSKLDAQVLELSQEIATLQDVTNEEEYLIVKKDDKYGFIDQYGQEKIACEYDKVSDFYEVDEYAEDYRTKLYSYYIAFAKQGSDYFVISKNNDRIKIEDDRILENIEKEKLGENNYYFSEDEMYYEEIDDFYGTVKILLSSPLVSYARQYVGNSSEPIELMVNNGKYYYNNGNYSMEIETLEESGISPYTQCRVVVHQNNEQTVEVLKIYGLDADYIGENSNEEYYSGSIYPLSDGYIAFKNIDTTTQGWFDNNGNKLNITTVYGDIYDIRNNKLILYQENEQTYEGTYNILDLTTGRYVLQTKYLQQLPNTYIIKNNQGKRIIVDNEFKQLSNEYDWIGD